VVRFSDLERSLGIATRTRYVVSCERLAFQ